MAAPLVAQLSFSTCLKGQLLNFEQVLCSVTILTYLFKAKVTHPTKIVFCRYALLFSEKTDGTATTMNSYYKGENWIPNDPKINTPNSCQYWEVENMKNLKDWIFHFQMIILAVKFYR